MVSEPCRIASMMTPVMLLTPSLVYNIVNELTFLE